MLNVFTTFSKGILEQILRETRILKYLSFSLGLVTLIKKTLTVKASFRDYEHTSNYFKA